MKRMWSEEEIQSFKKDISNLVDSKGNPRFIEGEGTPATITGFEASYCKWSLSGTHLMLVLAGTADTDTTLTGWVATYNLPDYIMNKIIPTFSTEVYRITATLWATDFTSQNVAVILTKNTDGKRIHFNFQNITLTKQRSFRVQFDLLIDSE